MSDSIDRVFVKAISTIRALSTRSNNSSTNAFPRPPIENRIRLYGLYKQATEGDVEGVMERPGGIRVEDQGARRKWDAWKEQEGITKTEAKRRYISYLIETMKIYASGTHDARELLSELEFLWDQIKDIEPSPTPSDHLLQQQQQQHHHQLSLDPTGLNTPNMMNMSLHTDHMSNFDSTSFFNGSSYNYVNNNNEMIRNEMKDVLSLKRELNHSLRRVNEELERLKYLKVLNSSHNGSGSDLNEGGLSWENIKKLGKLMIIVLGGVIKRIFVDLCVILMILKFIKFKNGIDVDMINMKENKSIKNRFLLIVFKILNRFHLIGFNRLSINID